MPEILMKSRVKAWCTHFNSLEILIDTFFVQRAILFETGHR